MPNESAKVSFKVVNDCGHVEFKSEGLQDEDVKQVLETFDFILKQNEACDYQTNDEDMFARFKDFFPPEIKEEEDHPENANYLETGIRYKKTASGWVPTYRVRYNCTNATCKNSGNRYVDKDSKTTKCHNCGERMEIREASAQGFPHKDEYNNFYLAGDVPR